MFSCEFSVFYRTPSVAHLFNVEYTWRVLFQLKLKFEGFSAEERLELEEGVLNIETKSKNSGVVKKKCSLISCVIIQIVAVCCYVPTSDDPQPS